MVTSPLGSPPMGEAGSLRISSTLISAASAGLVASAARARARKVRRRMGAPGEGARRSYTRMRYALFQERRNRSFESLEHGFDGQEQYSTVVRIFDEFRMPQVEPFGRLGLRVDQYGADADASGGDRDPTQGVSEEVGPETPAGAGAIDRQSADHRDGNRVRSIAPQLAGRGRAIQRACGNEDKGDDALSIANDIGAREPTFVVQRPLTQPIVERGFAAVEG